MFYSFNLISYSDSYQTRVLEGYRPYMQKLGISNAWCNRLIEESKVVYNELDIEISSKKLSSQLRQLDATVLPKIKKAGFEVFKRELRKSGAPESFISFALKTVQNVYAGDLKLPPLDELKTGFFDFMKRERQLIIDSVSSHISLKSIGFRSDSEAIRKTTSLVLQQNRIWGSEILGKYGMRALRDSVESHVFQVLTASMPVKYRCKVITSNSEVSSRPRIPESIIGPQLNLSILNHPRFSPLTAALDRLESLEENEQEKGYREVVNFFQQMAQAPIEEQHNMTQDLRAYMQAINSKLKSILERAMSEID